MGAVDILLASLVEYIRAKEDFISGNAEQFVVDEAKKRFANSLNEYVDHRVEASITRRRSHKSEERIALADTINSAMKSTVASVQSIRALNSAPPPPNTDDPEELRKWREAYEAWYNNERNKGVSIS